MTHTHCSGLSESISYGKTANLATKLIRKPMAAIIVIMRRFIFFYLFIEQVISAFCTIILVSLESNVFWVICGAFIIALLFYLACFVISRYYDQVAI